TGSRPTSRCNSGSWPTAASRKAGATSTTWRSASPSRRTSRSRSPDRERAAMPFLELSVRCRAQEQPRGERALEDVGALAVTLLDADAAGGNERAILEPGVGETPLWDAVTLSALFPADADGLLLLAALESFDPGLDWTAASFRKVEDQDWERAW